MYAGVSKDWNLILSIDFAKLLVRRAIVRMDIGNNYRLGRGTRTAYHKLSCSFLRPIFFEQSHLSMIEKAPI